MTDQVEVRVFMSDIRKARMCSRGARDFFVRHGLDWTEFLNEGIPASKLEATGDAMALQVVKVAEDGRKQ